MAHRYRRILPALAFAILLGASVSSCEALAPGSGSFFWDDATGASDADKPLDVFYYRPAVVTEKTPVWVIMHGVNRNADDYRDYFVNAAAAQGAMVVAPQFTTADWPGSRSYNLGNVSVSESNLTPREEVDWSFSKIEPLFDHLVNVLEPDIDADEYFMFGHSAGSQFVHRFLEWKPNARAKLAVAANAGWYTMPQYNDASYAHDWPYSLANTPDYDANTPAVDSFPVSNLESFLEKDLVVLLGDQDTQITSNLRQTPEANAQGLHRFSRGQFFFAEGEAEAAARAVDFGWELQIVPGVGHSGSQMAIPAAELFRKANLLPADFDQNGAVDGADLKLWEASFGTDSNADSDGDNDTDGADFLMWQRQFGNSSSTSAAAASIPEPTSATLLLIGFVIGCGNARSRRALLSS